MRYAASHNWQTHNEERKGLCLHFLSSWFDFLHSFAPSPFTLKLKYISTPALWPNGSPMSLFPLWLSIFCIFHNLNYFFISYLTLSTLFSNLRGEDFLRPTYSIRTPAQIFYCAPVCDTYVKVLILHAMYFACCEKQHPVWLNCGITETSRLQHLLSAVCLHGRALISLMRGHRHMFTLFYIRLSSIDSTASSHTFSSGGMTL